jgi:4-amino-4-deoxy-L-arabinose transferase-like glycosyltransferase
LAPYEFAGDDVALSPRVADARSSGWRVIAALAAVLAVASALRFLFPLADPPWRTTVGVVWHDEGAWVHNARNQVLFGAWRLDAWNPMYLTPVFTAFEYVSFRAFGVGTWQARLVSELAGLLAVLAIGIGVSALATRRAGLAASLMLATNYVYVMYDRAAIMESTMASMMVAAWTAYAFASSDRRSAPSRTGSGLLAGVFAILAFFTKASAASFVAALGADALLSIVRPRPESGGRDRRAGWITLAGLACAGAVALVVFVLPYWTEFRFYNWQMSVTRKPAYTLRAFLDRASWVPIVHDVSTRMWFETVLAVGAGFGVLAAIRRAAPAERMLVWWIGLGVIELVLHDTGNERRFVQFVPAVIALAALTLGRDHRLLRTEVASVPRRTIVAVAPLIAFAVYVVCGGLLRLIALYQTRPSVWIAAALAIALTAVLAATWPRVPDWIAQRAWRPSLSIVLLMLITMGDIAQYIQWAAGRSYKNYDASVALGRWLPAGTPVHGKLANGLSLENGIRPIFVGRGFGNYEDRLRRDDAQYLLTYVEPRLGYEGPVILDVLAAYPHWRILRTFDVAETPGGHDRAALILKGPSARLEGAASRDRDRPPAGSDARNASAAAASGSAARDRRRPRAYD